MYAALFMYPDERGKLQNRLVDLWVQVKEQDESAKPAHAAFIKLSSDLALAGFQRVLGYRALSWWTVTVSISLSLASACLVSGTLQPDMSKLLSLFLIASGLLFLAYGLLAVPSAFRRGKAKLAVLVFPLLCILTFSIPYLVEADFRLRHFYETLSGDTPWLLMTVSAGCLFGLICDIALLAINRILITAMSATERPSVLFVGVAYNLTWAVFLIDSLRYVHDPIYAVRDPLLSLFARISRSESLIGSVVKTVTVSFALSTNVFALMAASSVILVMVIALIHRFLWPIVGRLLNAVYEWELLSNPATQLCAGIAFLAFAFPIIAKILALFKPMVK